MSASTHITADTESVKPTSAAVAMNDPEVVKPAKPAPAQVVALSPADEHMADTYICYLMLFPLSPSSNNQEVYSTLKTGLSLTLSEIPFIGGYLASVAGAGGTRFQIRIDKDYGMRLVYRDFTAPDTQAKFKYSYAELKEDLFPVSAFKPGELMPVPFTAQTPEPAVMAVQTNFINGGLIMCVCLHHKASDALALAAILKAWAKHTRVVDKANGNNLDAAIDELTPRSMDRSGMCNGLVGRKVDDFPEYVVKNGSSEASCPAPAKKQTIFSKLINSIRSIFIAPAATATAVPAAAAAAPSSLSGTISPFGPLKICVVHLPATTLARLKQAASPPFPSTDWISTNDALCALLWRCITRVRTHLASTLLPPPPSSSSPPPLNLALALEARRRLIPALPAEYLGNAAFYCPVTSTLSTVISAHTPLSAVALLIRAAVTGFDDRKMRGVIGLLQSISSYSATATATAAATKPPQISLHERVYEDPLRGLIITSWADMGLYELVWGAGLGGVESVRVPEIVLPTGTPICGVFPRRRDGGLEVVMCLEEEAIKALRADEEFGGWVEWRC